MPVWRGNTYRFTVTAATAAAGDTYTNNGQTFTVTDAIAAGTVLFCTGTGAPTASGSLVRSIGAGTDPIVFSAVTAPNTNWGTSTNWLTDGSGAGVPTALTDAVFDNKSQNCTVNVAGLCRTLNFNSGTGYANTITMTNNIIVGSTNAATSTGVTLSPTMIVGGSGRVSTRSNNSVTLTSNGYVWPNDFGIGTTAVGVECFVTFVGNWTINGTLTIGAGDARRHTFVGAVNLTCNGNLFINIVGTQITNGIRGTSGSLTTLILAGNTSWTQAQPVSIGINININAPGNTVTIGNNCSYGGQGVTSVSNFTHTAGTVVTSGTFHLMFFATGATYTINLKGDSSTSATTTNTSGVNFSSLSLRTSVTSNVQFCTLSSPICVVNDFSITSFSSGTKNIAHLLSNNAYLNGSVAINGVSTSGTTVLRLQGTGTWSENDTLTAGVTAFGLSNPIVITGNYTLTSFVGVASGGGITYTSGTFVLTGYGLRVLGGSLTGFGSGGILIPTLYHTTSASGAASNARIILTDTVPFQITNLIYDGLTGTRAFSYAGNIGFIVNNFNYQQNSLVVSSQFYLFNSVTYVVLNSFIFNAVAIALGGNVMSTYTGTVPDAIFTLAPGASQDVFGMGAQNINSSAGQTIWSRKGLLSNATNWQNWTYPKTRFSSSIG